jgi:hypothetical protein
LRRSEAAHWWPQPSSQTQLSLAGPYHWLKVDGLLGKKEAGLDGTNLWAGIEAMNGPGHTSIPVRRTQGLQRARTSDKLVTPP